MAFAEGPGFDRVATGPRDAVPPAAPSHAAEAITRLEQEICDLWGYSLEAANRPFAERLVEVGRALRRAARSLDDDQDA